MSGGRYGRVQPLCGGERPAILEWDSGGSEGMSIEIHLFIQELFI